MDNTKKNRKFAESYEPKMDGSLADRFATGVKAYFRMMDSLTLAEKRKQKASYKKKMKEIVDTAISTIN